MIKTTGEEIARRVEAPTVTAQPPEPPSRHTDASEVGTAPPASKAEPATRRLSDAVVERYRTEYINVPASEHVQSTIRHRISQTTTSKPLSNGGDA